MTDDGIDQDYVIEGLSRISLFSQISSLDDYSLTHGRYTLLESRIEGIPYALQCLHINEFVPRIYWIMSCVILNASRPGYSCRCPVQDRTTPFCLDRDPDHRSFFGQTWTADRTLLDRYWTGPAVQSRVRTGPDQDRKVSSLYKNFPPFCLHAV